MELLADPPPAAAETLDPSEPAVKQAAAEVVVVVAPAGPVSLDPRKRSRSRSYGSRQSVRQTQSTAGAGVQETGNAGLSQMAAESLGLPRWLRSRSRSRSESAGGERRRSPVRSSCEAPADNSGAGVRASAASASSTVDARASAGAAASSGAAANRRPDPARVVAKLRTVTAGDDNCLALLTGIVCGRSADPQSFSRAEMRLELSPHIPDVGRLQELLQWLEQGHLDVGDTVQLQGLKAAPHLNGLLGKCEEWDRSGSRWKVLLKNGEVKSVKPNNLQASLLATDKQGSSRSGDAPAAATASTAPASAAENVRPHVPQAALNKLREKAEAEARGEGPQHRRSRKGDPREQGWDLPPRPPITFVSSKEKDAGPSKSVTVHDPRGAGAGADEDSDEDFTPGHIARPVGVPPPAPRPQRRVPRQQPVHAPPVAPSWQSRNTICCRLAADSSSPFEPSTHAHYAPYSQCPVFAAPAAAKPAVYVEGEGAASLPVIREERGGRYVTATPGHQAHSQGERFDGVAPGPPPTHPPAPSASKLAAVSSAPTEEPRAPHAAAGNRIQGQTEPRHTGADAAAGGQEAPVPAGNLYFAVSDAAREEDRAMKANQEKRKGLEERKTKMLADVTKQLQHCLARLHSGEMDEASREKYETIVFKLKAQMAKITDVD